MFLHKILQNPRRLSSIFHGIFSIFKKFFIFIKFKVLDDTLFHGFTGQTTGQTYLDFDSMRPNFSHGGQQAFNMVIVMEDLDKN